MQVGSPFAGKTTVSSALAQRFGVKLLVPEQLVTDAVAAAQAWEQQQQQSKSQGEGQHSQTDEQQQQQLGQQQAEAAASGNPEPSRQVLLGQRALQELQQGSAVSDELLVELLLQGMLQAKDYAPPPPEPPPAEAKGAKGAKTGVKAEAAAITAGKVPGQASAAGSTPGAAAAGGAAGASGGRGSDALLPAGAGAAGAQATGFVIDGFPATKQQAILLEKALTGLDLSAEQELVDKASVVAPPPLDVLPQLQRPLLSGLDAVLVLGCEDEGMAVKRALGKRLDPTTGGNWAHWRCAVCGNRVACTAPLDSHLSLKQETDAIAGFGVTTKECTVVILVYAGIQKSRVETLHKSIGPHGIAPWLRVLTPMAVGLGTTPGAHSP